MKLPSLHLPVIAVAGLLLGLGLWYILALMDALWVIVVIGLVLLGVLEAVARLSQAVIARVGGRGADTAEMPRLHGRERIVGVIGLILGLIGGYLIFGPIVITGLGDLA